MVPMPEAIFLSIRRPARAEGAPRATLQGFALSAQAGGPAVLTLATAHQMESPRPFADAFRALGLTEDAPAFLTTEGLTS